jgi:uncharacterized protein (DUF305 family)
MSKFKFVGIALATLIVGPAIAQSGGMHDMAGMDMSMMKPTAANPYPPAEMDMHKKMMTAVGADATETWVRKMIEHHRGAIAMSRIVLRETRDPKVRMMATKSSSEQTREIGELNAWLRAHGKRAQ